MTPHEFVERARQQPELTIDRWVNVPGPELITLLHSGRPLRVSDLAEHPDQRRELRRYRYGHVLGSGLTLADISRWREHSPLALGAPLIDLLQHVNGIHLWADIEIGRAYFGILPLYEWVNVRGHAAAILFSELPMHTLVLSYHDNGDYYLLFESLENRFTWFDPQCPGDSATVATSVDEFLDWWWDVAQELDPRQDPHATVVPPSLTPRS